MNELIDFGKRSAQDNAFTLILLLIAAIIVILILFIDRIKRRNNYVIWKKQTLNLGIYTREWERSDDIVLQQLFDENTRLENENKVLKKDYKHLSFSFALLLIVLIVMQYIKQLVKRE